VRRAIVSIGMTGVIILLSLCPAFAASALRITIAPTHFVHGGKLQISISGCFRDAARVRLATER